MYTIEEIEKLYEEAFADCNTLFDVSDKLATMRGAENEEPLRRYFCNTLLYVVSTGYIKYDKSSFKKDAFIELLCKNIKLLPKDNLFYIAVYHYFKQEYKLFFKQLEGQLTQDYEACKDKITSPDQFLDEGGFIDMFFEPFKEGYPGFWREFAQLLKKYPCQSGLPELCEVLDAYYSCKTDDEALEILLDALQKYPEFILIKELTAFTYYSLKMWNNAAAYFESIDGKAIFFREHDLHFMMGWIYGKLKRRKDEEACYRKSLEEGPEFIDTINNLGYCLYQQKRHQEAISYFERCLEMDPSYTYAANNIIRAYIALGRNKDAKAFVKSGKYKISRDLVKRVEKLDNTNARLKKDIVAADPEPAEEENTQANTVDLGIKRQQFSNEKLLEDELTARIEAGMGVFGLQLKMYKRKGEYGRQYIIPVGRLDLLCEDDEGNLYVIELKKDSGYDDAYKQTAQYLDWFEKSEMAKGKKVYGIICLNSPTKQLIDQVHNDKRMRLFEYQISYTER